MPLSKTSAHQAQSSHVKEPEFFSIAEIAARWRRSRGTVYNRLRKFRVPVLDFAPPGKRGGKAVRASAIRELEEKHSKPLR